MAKQADGSLTSRNEYNAFGEVAVNGASANSIGYTGQRLDNETGLMALGNGERYYSPAYARFIQQDSFSGVNSIPQSLNRFSYVHNNPNKFIDPSGHAGILATIGLGALIGGVAGGALEFAHQTVDVITGEREGYDFGEVGKSAATGAVIGAVIGSFGLLAGAAGVGGAFTVGMTVGGVGVGAASVAVSIEQGRYGHAAVDAIATLLPFAFKGVRTSTANSFKEFGIRPTGIRPPGLVSAREAWARIVEDTKGEIAAIRKAFGRSEEVLQVKPKSQPVAEFDDSGIYQEAESSRTLGLKNAERGTAEEYIQAREKLAVFRKNSELTSKNKMKLNLGYIEGKVKGLINGVSKNIELEGKVISSGQPDTDVLNVFKAKKVNSQNIINGDDAWLRITDSEYKGLNRLANELGAERGKIYNDIIGEIRVVSERNYCPSCQDVLNQFNEMFPNIKIKLIDGLR